MDSYISKKFGYEWDVYSGNHPLPQGEQFLGWISPVSLEFLKGNDFLDAGCGIGRNSMWPLQAGAVSAYAFDFDDRTVNVAKNNLNNFPNCEVGFCSIYDLPFKNEFDIAFCIGVIHHLQHPQQAVQKLMDTVKPGGIAIVWVYAREGNRGFFVVVRSIAKDHHIALAVLDQPLDCAVFHGDVENILADSAPPRLPEPLAAKNISPYGGDGARPIDSHDRPLLDQRPSPRACRWAQRGRCQFDARESNVLDAGIEKKGSMKSAVSSYLKRWTVIGGLYVALVAALHHEVLARLSTNIIAGWQVGGVLVWECWWFQKSIIFEKALTPFFTNMIMFPVGVPISMHSPLYTLFGCLAASPLKNPYSTYNLYCLAGYVLRGLSMAVLAYYLTQDSAASFFSGLVFMFSHDNLTQNFLGHAGEANTAFVPIFTLGLLMSIREKSWRAYFIFLIGAIGCVLTTPYIGFHMFVFLFPTVIIFYVISERSETLRQLFSWRFILFLIAVGAIGALAYWPLLSGHGAMLGGAETYALKPRSFFLPPFWRRFPYWHDWIATDTPEDRMGFSLGLCQF